MKTLKRFFYALRLTTWDGRKYARYETDQHIILTFPMAWEIAGIIRND